MATIPAKQPRRARGPAAPVTAERSALSRKEALAERRKQLFANAPGRSQLAMTQPKRNATISSSALRQVTDETPATKRRRKNRSNADRNWQSDAFDYADKVGELGALINLQANVVSLCAFPVRHYDDNFADWVANDAEVDDKGKQAKDYDDRPPNVMRSFVGPDGSQAELIRRAAYNLFCTGETTLLGTKVDNDNGILWEFLSVEELFPDPSGNYIRFRAGVGAPAEKLPDDNFTGRCWRPSARFSDLAESEVKRVLPILQEIVTLTQMVDAIAKSRLAANMIFIPDELSFAGSNNFDANDPDNTDADADADVDDLVDELFAHMTAPVANPASAARLVPLILRGKGEFGQYIQVIDLSRQLDLWAQELRAEALKRLGQGLDAPPEIISGKGTTNHWCTDETTRILTRDHGWVTHDLLEPGDLVMTLDHDTGLSSWQPVGEVKRWSVTDLEMMSIETRHHSSLTTMNHRWPTVDHIHGARRWRTSETLTDSDQFVRAAPTTGRVTEAKWADALVELVAWFATEGTCRYHEGHPSSPPQVLIGQSHVANPANVARIRRCLHDLFGPDMTGNMATVRSAGTPAWRETIEDRGMTMFSLNKVAAEELLRIAPDRVIDRSWIHDLTTAQLALLVETFIDGDGTRGPTGRATITQTDPSRLDAVELAAILLGRGTSRPAAKPGRGFSDRPQHILSLHAARPLAGSRNHRETATYTGTIWCPTTPNRTWLAERNGTVYYTGNTAANIDSEFIVKHIQPIGILIADFLTMAYLRPMLMSFEGMKDDEANHWKLEFDPSPVIARADEAKSARDLAEWLSDEAIVAANGFTTADMANLETVRVRRLWQLVSTQPGQFGRLLPLIPGMEDVDPKLLGPAAPQAPVGPDGKPVPAAAPLAPLGPDGQPVAEKLGPDGKPVAEQTPKANVNGSDQVPVGTKAPTNGGSDNGKKLGLLFERIATASDRALTAALGTAASRIVSLAATKNHDLRERVRSVPKHRVLSMCTESDLASLSMTRDKLLRGTGGTSVFDELGMDVRGWIRTYLETEGHALSLDADERAARASSDLTNRLQQLLSDNLLGQFRVGPNGLRISTEFVTDALEQALPVGVG